MLTCRLKLNVEKMRKHFVQVAAMVLRSKSILKTGSKLSCIYSVGSSLLDAKNIRSIQIMGTSQPHCHTEFHADVCNEPLFGDSTDICRNGRRFASIGILFSHLLNTGDSRHCISLSQSKSKSEDERICF